MTSQATRPVTSRSQGLRAAPVLAQGVEASVTLPAPRHPSRQSQIDGLITQTAWATSWPLSQPTVTLSPAVAAWPGSSRILVWQSSGVPSQGAGAQMAATQLLRVSGPGCGSLPHPLLCLSLGVSEDIPACPCLGACLGPAVFADLTSVGTCLEALMGTLGLTLAHGPGAHRSLPKARLVPGQKPGTHGIVHTPVGTVAVSAEALPSLPCLFSRTAFLTPAR